MGDTVGRPETVRANPEEQESNRTTATPAVDSSIAGKKTDIQSSNLEPVRLVKPSNQMTVDLNRYSYFRMIASYRTSVYLETATSGRTVTVTGRMSVRITVIAEKATDVAPLRVIQKIFAVLVE